MVRTSIKGRRSDKERFCGRSGVVRSKGEAEDERVGGDDDKIKKVAASKVEGEAGCVHMRALTVEAEGWVEKVWRVVVSEVDEVRGAVSVTEADDRLARA
ncbi:hypothetical protein MMC18_004603 [Xylographa bjoerkii]|nr:hypothetical protein [Xylographa bjoerkii]